MISNDETAAETFFKDTNMQDSRFEREKTAVLEVKIQPRAGAGVNKSLRRNKGYSVFYQEKPDVHIPSNIHMHRAPQFPIPPQGIMGARPVKMARRSSPMKLGEESMKFLKSMQ